MRSKLFLSFLLFPILIFANPIHLNFSFTQGKHSGYTTAPGSIRQPIWTVNVLLPAGAVVESFNVEFGTAIPLQTEALEYNGAWFDGERSIKAEKQALSKSKWVYLGQKKWGDLRFASFQFAPQDYLSKIWHPSCEISISFSSERNASNRIPSTLMEKGFFANGKMLDRWYRQEQSRNYDFLVVSTPDLYAALGSWVSFRQSQGLVVAFADIATVLASSVGLNDADKLRNYLANEYFNSHFKYLMLVGDHDLVPVAYLCPEPDGFDTVPSDFYFSDLSSLFDTDVDGRLGEYSAAEGMQDWGVDFTPEVFVGRISSNSADEVSEIATRIVSFESSNEPYKNKALLPAAFLNYNDEPELGMSQTDGADFMEYAKQTTLRQYETTTMYEQAGVVLSHPCDIDISSTSFNMQLRDIDYGLINWSAHGSPISSARKIWIEDYNNDNIPDSYEMAWSGLVNLNSFNDITAEGGSVIFAASCFNGMIDHDVQSLAERALAKKGVAVMAATRTGWYKIGWKNPGYGGLSSYNHHFLENYAEQKLSVGSALAYANLMHSMYYMFGDPIDSGGIIWPELQNVYAYMLFGDPAIGYNAQNSNAPLGEVLIYEPEGNSGIRVANAIRDIASLNVVYSDRLIPDYDYLGAFDAVLCLLGDFPPEPNSLEYNLLVEYIQGGGNIYMEGAIAWNPEDALYGKFGTYAPMDLAVFIERIAYNGASQAYVWEYGDSLSSTVALAPYVPGASVLFSTLNQVHPNADIGILNVTDFYRSVASAYRLGEVVDSAEYGDLKQMLLVMLNEFGMAQASSSMNAENMVPAIGMTIHAYPNPMRDRLSIALKNASGDSHDIEIFNLKGQKIQSLKAEQAKGYNSFWDGKDAKGVLHPSGVYLIKSGEASKKITLVK